MGWEQRNADFCKAQTDAQMAYIEAELLRRENAKLRELLSVMAYCNQFRRDCDGCRMNGAAGIVTERAGCDELLDRLRELGVTDHDGRP